MNQANSHSRVRVLIVIQDGDVLAHVANVVGERYLVEAVSDGERARAAAQARRPDVILSDVAMPEPGGFGWLRELRRDPALKTIPLIVLSPQPVEEHCTDGSERDDGCIVMPFTDRELLARIDAHLQMSRVRNEAQAEITRSRRFLERMAEATADILFIFDIVNGKCIYANRNLETVLGYTLNELQSQPTDLTEWLVHADDLAGVRGWYARFDGAMDGEVREHEYRVRHADGSYRWLSLRAVVFDRSPDGKVMQIIGAAADLTDRKRTQAQLRAELEDTKLLQRISAEIIRQEPAQLLYEKIIDGAMAIMRSHYASMQMFHPERGNGGELRLLAFRGFSAEAAKFWEWVRLDSNCACGAALRQGRRVVIPDVRQCEWMAGTADLEMSLATGIQAVQTTPLVSRSGKLVGMISTHWRETHQPSERQLRLFDIIARQAADIIERKQAEDVLRRKHEELRAHADELARFNRVAVDRELRMVELKKEINRLRAELGRPPLYRMELEREPATRPQTVT